jgi:hypothetical protein
MYQWRLGFLPTFRVVVLLFPPERSGWAALPLVLCGLWCFELVFSWFSFRFLTGSFSSKRPVEWRCSGSCRRRRAGRIFIFSLIFMMPDLRSFVGFGETRAPQTCSSSSSVLIVPCIGRSGQQWPARVHHAPGFFSVWTCVMATLRLFWLCRGGDEGYEGRSAAGCFRGRRV